MTYPAKYRINVEMDGMFVGWFNSFKIGKNEFDPVDIRGTAIDLTDFGFVNHPFTQMLKVTGTTLPNVIFTVYDKKDHKSLYSLKDIELIVVRPPTPKVSFYEVYFRAHGISTNIPEEADPPF